MICKHYVDKFLHGRPHENANHLEGNDAVRLTYLYHIFILYIYNFLYYIHKYIYIYITRQIEVCRKCA